jgi:hypothetical protein
VPERSNAKSLLVMAVTFVPMVVGLAVLSFTVPFMERFGEEYENWDRKKSK